MILAGRWGFGMLSKSWSSTTTCGLFPQDNKCLWSTEGENLHRSAFLFTPHQAWAGRIHVLLWSSDISCVCFGVASGLVYSSGLSLIKWNMVDGGCGGGGLSGANLKPQTRTLLGQVPRGTDCFPNKMKWVLLIREVCSKNPHSGRPRRCHSWWIITLKFTSSWIIGTWCINYNYTNNTCSVCALTPPQLPFGQNDPQASVLCYHINGFLDGFLTKLAN